MAEKESLKALQAELAVKETRAKFQDLQAAAKAAEVNTHTQQYSARRSQQTLHAEEE